MTTSTRRGLVLIQLGSPASPSVHDVRVFLKEFLGDPRVVDLPRWLWFLILYGIILVFRPRSTAKLYQRIWDGTSFPLITHTARLAEKLQSRLGDRFIVRHAFIIGTPSLTEVMDEMSKSHCEHVTFLPLFPQNAEATIASAHDAVQKALASRVSFPHYSFICGYHDHPFYIQAFARSIQQTLASHPTIDRLFLSFHGYPLKRIQEKNDPYLSQCETSAALVMQQLGFLKNKIEITFQSKFGRDEWLTPATDVAVLQAAKQGCQRIAVCFPGFAADCLETIDEIGLELRKRFMEAGGKELIMIPCLNDQDHWVEALTTLFRPTTKESPAWPLFDQHQNL